MFQVSVAVTIMMSRLKPVLLTAPCSVMVAPPVRDTPRNVFSPSAGLPVLKTAIVTSLESSIISCAFARV